MILAAQSGGFSWPEAFAVVGVAFAVAATFIAMMKWG